MPVAQGLCPVFCGRRSACSLDHFRMARDKEGFVHPGLLTPGMIAPFGQSVSPPIPGKPSGKRPLEPAVVPTVVEHGEAEVDGSVDDLVEAFERVVRAAKPGDLPAAWMRAAQSTKGADFISLFDGAKGNINRAASAFDLDGMPPVDLNAKHPIDL